MTSQPHRATILSHLNELCVNSSISLGEIVGLIHEHFKVVMFIDSNLPKETNHNSSLHITVECNGFKVLRVLIDNGSAICPFRVLIGILT